MEIMDKGLTVPKWVLMNWPKILKIPQNVSAQIVCQSPKTLGFRWKKVSLGVHSLWSPIYCSHHRKCIYTITFLVVSRTFMTNTAVSPICQYLIQLLFVEKKLQIFRKALVLEGTWRHREHLEGSRKATLVGKSENVFISCWNIIYSKYIQHEILTLFQIPTPPIKSYVFLRLLLDGLVLCRGHLIQELRKWVCFLSVLYYLFHNRFKKIVG